MGGLSLCIQGTFPQLERLTSSNRFIPVYTGNITIFIALQSKDPVYPCVYREHEEMDRALKKASGLSLCIQGTSAVHRR